MPYTTSGVFYPAPYSIPGAARIPQLVSVDGLIGKPFSMEGASNMLATLFSHEFKQTAVAGAQNDLVFFARNAGVNTPAITVTYAVAGNNTLLTVTVATTDITVHVATDGSGNPTSTGAQIKAAVDAYAPANALVTISLAAGNDGTGVVAAMSAITLTGPSGVSPTLDIKLQTAIDETSYTTPTGTYFDVDAPAAFAQLTAASKQGHKFTGIGTSGQWVGDIGAVSGTPVFAISINTLVRPIASVV